jgi:hypothetical protein
MGVLTFGLATGFVITAPKSPLLTASIGRSAGYIASSTCAASSISNSDTPENPRIFSGFSGNPTIRDPLGNSIAV